MTQTEPGAPQDEQGSPLCSSSCEAEEEEQVAVSSGGTLQTCVLQRDGGDHVTSDDKLARN